MPPIIFFNRFYAPDESATAQILTDLAEHLAADARDVTAVASRALYGRDRGLLARRETIAGVKVRRVLTPSRRAGMAGRVAAYLTYYVGAVRAGLASPRGAIWVIKTDPPLLSAMLMAAARLRRARVVHWLQDLYPEVAAAHGVALARGPIGRSLRALRDRSLRHAAAVVPIGERMADYLRDRGIAADRITILPNWTDDVAIRPRNDGSPLLRDEWGIARDAFVVGYSGNLGRAHEVDTLLDAAHRLRARKDILFLFVGRGDVLKRASDQAAARALSNLRFAPFQPRERLAEALAVPDVHWISLLPEFEGWIVPSKMFGVCAAGRPIVSIAARDGEVARLVLPSGAGVVVTPGDGGHLAAELAALADNRAGTRAMGRAARALLDARFSRARTLERWRRLLDGVGGHI